MLVLYKRRHDDDCLGRLASKKIISTADTASLMEQDKKALLQYRGRDCRCAFWIRGTNDYGKFISPRSLKAYTLEAAIEKVKEFNQPDTVNEVGISIDEACKRWISELRLAEKSESTIHQYEHTVGLLVKRCNGLKPSVTELAKVTPDMVNQLRAVWVSEKKSRNTHRNRLGWLSSFFIYAQRMGWINDCPTSRVAPVRKARPTDADPDEATLPLDVSGDANYRKILAGIPEYLAGRIGSRESKKPNPNPYPIRARTSPLGLRPDHLTALAELMYETGLRVSDAVFFRVDDLIMDTDGGTYTTRQIKTGHEVTVYPPLWLSEKLRRLEKLSPEYIFIDKANLKTWKAYIVNNVYAYLRNAGEAVGVPGVRPHRFRDSFAVNRLNEGLLLEEVQRLLGHQSLETTERYYAPFVKSRQDHLKSRVLAARTTRKTPVEVVDISKKRA